MRAPRQDARLVRKFTYQSSSSSSRSWSCSRLSCPRISPPALRVVCTFAYESPDLIALTNRAKASSPLGLLASTPCDAGPAMSAAVQLPVTAGLLEVPSADAGQSGLIAFAGPPPQKKTATPPTIVGLPTWI